MSIGSVVSPMVVPDWWKSSYETSVLSSIDRYLLSYTGIYHVKEGISMSCSQCVGIEDHFDQKKATEELQKYRNEGPVKTTRMLIDALIAEGISEMTLLDIGGGIGALQHELLKAGVSSCINVEASKAYIKATKEEAERQGHADCIDHIHGDFIDLAEDLPQCDIVTLDRVICCYHDVQGLVEKSSALARRVYCLVYPFDRWSARIGGALENLSHRLHRSPFRFFVHPPKIVEEIVRNNGFERRFYREAGMWQIAVYGRVH
jgi:2-polyprenyl-3-methyl-5-hydroxy-6-metoxy-1,4-benzoquinol methylase